MSRRISSLSDQELSDVFTASIMAHSVYLEEKLEFNNVLLGAKLTNKSSLQDLWNKYKRYNEFYDLKDSDPKYNEKLAEIMTGFTNYIIKEKKDIYDKLLDEKSLLYQIEFKEFAKNNPIQIMYMAKEDTQKMLYREVFKLFRDEFHAPGLHIIENRENFKKSLNELFDINLNQMYIEEKRLDKVILNQVKASMITQNGFKQLKKIKPEFMNLEEHGKVKTKGGYELEYSINNGLVEIGEPKKEKDTSFLISFYRNPEGKPELHISFRGTEPNAKGLAKYFAYDYQNMERHYDNMEPVLEQVIDSINKKFLKHGNTLNIKLSGHSLGGAMVEKFLEKHPDTNNIKYKACTFGSPGALHKTQKFINTIDNVSDFVANKLYLKNLAKVGRFTASLTTNLAVVATTGLLKPFHFFNVGKELLTKVFPYRPEDPRLTSVKHIGDAIPKAGSAIYRMDENAILFANENQSEGVKDHKMYNYMNEIIQEIVRRPSMYQNNEVLFALDKSFNETPYLKSIHHNGLLDRAMTQVNNKISLIRKKMLTEAQTDDYNNFSKMKV